MNILLINSNPVVSRLFSLCARDETFFLEEAQSIDKIKNDRYDLIFVDDDSYTEEVQERIKTLNVLKTVFLTQHHEENPLFDKTLVKPFLPSQIMRIVKEANEEANQSSQLKSRFIFPLSSEILEDEDLQADENDFAKTSVLSDDEIEKIKNLLDMDEDEEIYGAQEEMDEEKKIEIIKRQLMKDGLEILDEEDFFESFIQDNTAGQAFAEESGTAQTMQSKEKENTDAPLALEESLLQAIAGMKVKKIRKLLKGAEISITIRFRDEAK